MSTFQITTAKHFQSKCGGSFHNAFRDASGNILMHCIGRSDSGGVAVNEAGLEWLRSQTGNRFIRLTNTKTKFEVIVALERFPDKLMNDGAWGRYAFFDPADFGGEPAMPALVAVPVPF